MTREPDPLRINFHPLDRQIVDSAGEPVGKVDDVELTLDGVTGRLQVTALLSGQQVLSERLRGRLGRWMAGVARRLHPVENPPPLRIELRQVADIGSAVALTIRRETLPTPPLEHWLAEHVITRIPGAGHAGSDVIGRAAHGPDGTLLGRIADILTRTGPDGTPPCTRYWSATGGTGSGCSGTNAPKPPDPGPSTDSPKHYKDHSTKYPSKTSFSPESDGPETRASIPDG